MRILPRWIVTVFGVGLFALAITSAAANETRLAGDFVQGGLIRGQAPPGTQVWILDRRIRVSPKGCFVFGFGRDFAATARLRLRYPDGTDESRDLAIEKRKYQTQRIDGLAPKMVTPDQAALKRIRREAAEIRAVRARDTAKPWFAEAFDWPVVGLVSGIYGSQRILNGEPRRPHFGIDIAAPEGTVVRAPASGQVALAEADLYFTGGTVMLDHGHGVTSVYSHLATVSVKVGEIVARGDSIATVGSTGRSTGAHLDWRINWFKQRLDPALLAGPMPKPATKPEPASK